ncbi:MAG: discoidin domain-containing protein, partial [Bacteroidales bacterium]|nr:discoidin domain-containing protein [Bacteroidales bacterium]
GGNVSVTGTINPWDVVTPEISLTEPADGADLLIYDEAPAYRFQWTPLDGITNYTVKIATTQAGLATTPLTFEVTSDNYRDVTIDECKAILAAAGITNNGNTHTLYWTVVPTYWTTTRYGIRSVKVSYPNILPKNLWPWIGASDCYEYDCSNPENRPENAIDGDLNTSWRCAWVNASEHRLSIDLGKVCTISKIIIHSSNEFLPPKRMRFIREEVMGTQISLGDQFMFSQSSPEVGSVHVLDQPVSARYLTIDVVESTYDNSNNANIQVMIAEIDLE